MPKQCDFRQCDQRATWIVTFTTPNLLAGEQRQYCGPHADHVGQQAGTRRRLIAHRRREPATT